MAKNKKVKEKLNSEDKSRVILTYSLTVIGLVFAYLIISTIAFSIYKSTFVKLTAQVFSGDGTINPEETVDNETKPVEIPETKNTKTNVLILGTDYTGGLTDVMLAACFDTKTMKMALISIPRDTYIDFDKKTVEAITKAGNAIGMDIKKINGVYGMSGYDVEYTLLETEKLLNVSFDYYAVIDTAAFRKIVDDVGGIEMTLTRNYNYYDPTQDFRINLKKGTQVLMGDEAEQFVRFRIGNNGGDIERIETQQLFMKEFFKQVLNKKTIMNNAFNFISTFITYVKTDFGIEDIPTYLPYITKLNGENFNFHTLPGEDKKLDYYYFIHDKVETAKLVNSIFYDDSNDASPSRDLKVRIVNSTEDVSLGSKKKDQLLLNGYKNVSYTSVYAGETKENTIIYVKEVGNGEDLIVFFNSPSIEVNPNLSNDIEIVLGTEDL